VGVDVEQIRSQLEALRQTLRNVVALDSEQEVQGIAIAVLDGVLSAARQVVPDNPAVQGLHDVISVEAAAEAEPVRAVDALLVTEQLLAALPPPPPIVRSAPLIA